jgi:hypothetical protein
MDYSLQHAEALAKVRGIEDCHYIALCEPHVATPYIVDQLNRIPCRLKSIIVNDKVMGCGKNTYQALSLGFGFAKASGDDFVVHVEDDVLLAVDALEMFAHCRDTYRHDYRVLNVTAWNRDTRLHHDGMARELLRKEWFSPWGWGTWADRWRDMELNWVNDPWDITINSVTRMNRVQVYPTLSRSQNIGEWLGEYCPGPEWHKENQHCTKWARDVPEMTTPGEWKEKEAAA